MKPIKYTKIYRATVKAYAEDKRYSADRRKLARHLAKARKAGRCNFNERTDELISCLVWSDSPQGGDFWAKRMHGWHHGMGR